MFNPELNEILDIQKERVRLLRVQLIHMTLGSFFSAAIVSLLMWSVTETWMQVGWMTGVIGLSGLRWKVLRGELNENSIRKLFVKYNLLALASGLWWGLGSILMVQFEQQAYLFILLFCIGGFVTGTMLGAASWRPAYLLFLSGCLLPLALYIAIFAPGNLFAVSLMIFAYYLTHVFFSKNISHSLTRSISLAYENSQLLEEVREQAKNAQEANLEKSRFIATASHDLRQPLYAIGLLFEGLKNASDEDERKPILEHIEKSLAAANNMFNRLLDLSRLEASAITPEIVSIPVDEIFDLIKRTFSRRASQQGVKLSVRPCSLYIKTDPVLLIQVISNIVSNALDHAEATKIVVGARRNGSQVRILVLDNGSGIAETDRSRIFDEFVQLPRKHGKDQDGTGLGLAISQRLSLLLGSRISVGQVDSGGIWFDIFQSISGNQAQEGAASNRDTGSFIFDLRILVVDDEPVSLYALRTILNQNGAEVKCCAGLAELHQLQAQENWIPDLAISDYHLGGGVTGFDVIRFCREVYDGKLPVVLITGDMSINLEKNPEFSDVTVLRKPIDASHLIESIRDIVYPQ